jgi:hypothetical protein
LRRARRPCHDRLPLALELDGAPRPAVGLGQFHPRLDVVGCAAHGLVAERDDLGQRAERAGVPSGPGPSGGREVVAARELQVPRDLGAGRVAVLVSRFDGQRDSQMGALRVAQVRPGGLGQQRVPVRDAAAHAPYHPRVEKAAFGVRGGPQRGELRH